MRAGLRGEIGCIEFSFHRFNGESVLGFVYFHQDYTILQDWRNIKFISPNMAFFDLRPHNSQQPDLSEDFRLHAHTGTIGP